MQPKPELIRLLGNSRSCRESYAKRFSFLYQLRQSRHFVRFLIAVRHFMLLSPAAGKQPAPLLLFSTHKKASRTGSL